MLIRQIRVVFMTYLARPAYHRLILAMAIGLLIGWYATQHNLRQWQLTSVLAGIATAPLLFGSAIVALLLFFLQAREQLMGLRAQLSPESRTAHLVVISVLFCIATVAFSAAFWDRPHSYNGVAQNALWIPGVSPAGEIVVVLTFMTLVAYTTWSLWFLPVLCAAIYLSLNNPFVHEFESSLRTWWPNQHRGTGLGAALFEMRLAKQRSDQIAVFLVNLVALLILSRLAKPRPVREGVIGAAIRRLNRSMPHGTSPRRTSLAVHVPMSGLLARGRHRRLAVHGRAVPWVLAVGVAGVLAGMMLLAGVRARENERVMAALVMLSLLPGVVVAAGWRERWTSLGYESLLPSPRMAFVCEIAIALATDLAVFWVASLAMVIVVLAFFARNTVASTSIALSIVASAMAQILWLGAIFSVSRFRQVLPYSVMLVGVGLVVFLPIFDAWSDARLSQIPLLLHVAAAEMTVGIILLAGGLGLWRKADLS